MKTVIVAGLLSVASVARAAPDASLAMIGFEDKALYVTIRGEAALDLGAALSIKPTPVDTTTSKVGKQVACIGSTKDDALCAFRIGRSGGISLPRMSSFNAGDPFGHYSHMPDGEAAVAIDKKGPAVAISGISGALVAVWLGTLDGEEQDVGQVRCTFDHGMAGQTGAACVVRFDARGAAIKP